METTIYKTNICLLAAALALNFSSCKHHEGSDVREPVRVSTTVLSGSAEAGDNAASHYSGTIEAGSGTDLSFLDGGTVKNVYVKVGDKVAKGALLADLDNVQLTSAYDIARAELNEARDAYKRLEMLHNAKALPEIKWVEMKSKLSQAESAAEIARKALSNTRLYAPTGGVIASRSIEKGMNVAPAIPVMRLVTVKDVKAAFGVPENRISGFKEGMKCTFTADGVAGKTYSGILTEKGVEANPLTREFTVKFDVENPDSRLLPGMICNIEIEPSAQSAEEGREWRPVLPLRAVLLDYDNHNFVWLKKDGRAEKRYVTVGSLTDTGLTIDSGLQAGDSVIVDGQQKISAGMAVTEAL